MAWSASSYPSTTEWHLAERVNVSSTLNTPNIDFSLVAGGALSGKVTESDNVTPIEGVFVHASDFNTGNYGNGATTERDGTYTIDGLRPGSYRVETWVPDNL